MGNGVFVECGKLILRLRLTNSNLKLSIRDKITIGPITCVCGWQNFSFIVWIWSRIYAAGWRWLCRQWMSTLIFEYETITVISWGKLVVIVTIRICCDADICGIGVDLRFCSFVVVSSSFSPCPWWQYWFHSSGTCCNLVMRRGY